MLEYFCSQDFLHFQRQRWQWLSPLFLCGCQYLLLEAHRFRGALILPCFSHQDVKLVAQYVCALVNLADTCISSNTCDSDFGFRRMEMFQASNWCCLCMKIWERGRQVHITNESNWQPTLTYHSSTPYRPQKAADLFSTTFALASYALGCFTQT